MAKVTGQAVALWMLFAVITGIITYVFYRRGKMKLSTAIIIPILVFYLSFVLTITIFSRTSRKRMRYNLELFWTVKSILSGKTYLLSEMFWNIVLFVPTGALVSALLPKRRWWLSVVIGMSMSAGIEVAQLLTRRGLFEFDDIIFNTLGATVGVGLCLLLKRLGGGDRWKKRIIISPPR